MKFCQHLKNIKLPECDHRWCPDCGAIAIRTFDRIYWSWRGPWIKRFPWSKPICIKQDIWIPANEVKKLEDAGVKLSV